MIKFLDIHKINNRFEEELKNEFHTFLNSGQYILGDALKQFEAVYANYCGTDYCLGVSNGLDALTLIFNGFKTLGRLKAGDQVIVPANTYIASVLSIINSGLEPVLVEPCEKTYNISATELEKHITKKTKAVMAVHLYGQLANMELIKDLARKYNLIVIEDAAQSHGAMDTNGNKAGNFSNAAAFSFYPTKNLGALGDAGAVTTNDEELYKIIKKLRNYGSEKKYVSELVGFNNRMDELQAVFLNMKLKFLDVDNEARRRIAKRYLNEINNPKVLLPFYEGARNHVFHLFVVRVEKRDAFLEHLKKCGVQALVHYPVSPHKQKALIEFVSLKLPITEAIHDTVVSLPISPVMTNEEVDAVIKSVNTYN